MSFTRRPLHLWKVKLCLTDPISFCTGSPTNQQESLPQQQGHQPWQTSYSASAHNPGGIHNCATVEFDIKVWVDWYFLTGTCWAEKALASLHLNLPLRYTCVCVAMCVNTLLKVRLNCTVTLGIRELGFIGAIFVSWNDCLNVLN